jgi:hypothetical protein
LADLDPASVDDDLVPALLRAFPGFKFSLARIDDDYWRDARSVIRPDRTRLGEPRPWMMATERPLPWPPMLTAVNTAERFVRLLSADNEAAFSRAGQ